MKRIEGVALDDAAHGLKISSYQLRKYLKEQNAIRKTDFGWIAENTYKERGLLQTETRQHIYKTTLGRSITKNYTVVIVTGDGLSWLESQLPETEH